MFSKFIKLALVSISILSMLGLNANASAAGPSPIRKITNNGGVFLRDYQCNKTHLLLQGTYLETYAAYDSGVNIICNVGGVNYTLYPVSVIGAKEGYVGGYSYIDGMAEGGPDASFNFGTAGQQEGFAFAKIGFNTNIRDINCQKTDLANAGEVISIYRYEDGILCNINGTIYRMFNVQYKGQSAYMTVTSF